MDYKNEKSNITNEIILLTKATFESTVLQIYKQVKKSNTDNEFLLKEYQLELRNIKKWKKGEIKQANYKLKKESGLDKLLENLYMINKEMFHIRELDLKYDENLSMIDNFFKDVCLQIARGLWKQPHIVYEIYDNKMYTKFQPILDKLIQDSIIYVLRRKASDELTMQVVDELSSNALNTVNVLQEPVAICGDVNLSHDIMDEIENVESEHSFHRISIQSKSSIVSSVSNCASSVHSTKNKVANNSDDDLCLDFEEPVVEKEVANDTILIDEDDVKSEEKLKIVSCKVIVPKKKRIPYTPLYDFSRYGNYLRKPR